MTNLFRRLFAKFHDSRCLRPRRNQLSKVPAWVQLLEPRQLLTTITVSSTADSGAGSLRAAIVQANVDSPGDVIQFAGSLTASGPTTINITSALIITNSMTITGPGANLLTLNGNNSSQIFILDDNSAAFDQVSISGLKLTGGNATGLISGRPLLK